METGSRKENGVKTRIRASPIQQNRKCSKSVIRKSGNHFLRQARRLRGHYDLTHQDANLARHLQTK